MIARIGNIVTRAFLSGLFAVALVPAAVQAAEAPVITYVPAGPWTLDATAERCMLMREFRSDGQLVQLQLNSNGSFGSFNALVFNAPVPDKLKIGEKVRLRFANEAEWREAYALSGPSQGKPAMSVLLGFLPKPDEGAEVGVMRPRSQDFEKAATGMAFDVAGKVTLDFPTGQMNAAMDVMRACVRSLYKGWGADPAVQENLVKAALPGPAVQENLVKAALPGPAVVRGIAASHPSNRPQDGFSVMVPVRVNVSAQGRPSNCVVQDSTVDPKFAEALCKAMRGTYSPAIGPSGAAVDSVMQMNINFKMFGG